MYVISITADPKTTEETAASKSVEVKEEILYSVQVRFPPGCMGFLKVAVFYGAEQIFPSFAGEWLSGDDEVIEDILIQRLPEVPCKLTVKAYNEAEDYPHTAIVRLRCITERELRIMTGREPAESMLRRLLRGLGLA